MEPCQHPQRKRHAQLRHQPGAAPLWVGDPQDWETARRLPRPPLVCPEPGCEVELISYENLNNKYNPRIFKFKSAQSCDHWPDRGQGGGPETPQHEWMTNRLTRIARNLGYTATPEHPPTRSDVFVHEPGYSLEVQLHPTQFGKRTAARQRKGAQVCWFIREGLDTPRAVRALFHMPAVRFRVLDKNSPTRHPIAPWNHPGDHDLSFRARLQVFGTIAHPPRPGHHPDLATPGSAWFRTGAMDGFQFLLEILAGQRRWYPPNALGHKSGLWVLDSDVADYRLFQEQQRQVRAQQPQQPPGSPTTPATPATAEGDTVSTHSRTCPDDPPTMPLPITPAQTPSPEQPQVAVGTHIRPPRRWWQFWKSNRLP